MGSLFSGSATYLAANALNAVIPLALLPVLTRYLTPAGYGELAMFQSLLAGLGALVGVNVAGAIARKHYDPHVERLVLGRFIGACLQILALSAAAIFLAFFLARDFLGSRLGIGADWVLWAVFASGSLAVINIRLVQWQVSRRAASYGAMQVAQSALAMGLSLLWVVALGQGAEGAMGAQVWSAGLFMVISLVLLWKDDLFALLVWDPSALREALRFGLPLLPHTAGIFLLSAVDRIVIQRYLGLESAGAYMVAAQVSLGLALVFDAVNKAYVPWLYERLQRDDPAEKRHIVRLTYQGFVVALALAALAFALGPPLVVLLAGPGYSQAADAVGWLALGQAFGGMYLLVTNYVFYSRKTGWLSLATLATGGLNIALLVLLVPRLGIAGAAVAFAMSMAIRFVMTWCVAQRRHPMPWFDFRGKSFTEPEAE